MSERTTFVMPRAPWIDVRNPTAAMIDIPSLCERAAKEARFNGGTPGVLYVVGQHLVLAADAAFNETGDRELAGYVLAHDFHEATGVKDITTPFKNAIAETAHEEFGVVAPVVLESFARLTDRHDLAIHTAIGLRWPICERMRCAIKHYDDTMLVTEWRDLMEGCPHPDWQKYRSITPLPDRIEPWPWERARDELLARCRKYLPVFV